MDVDNLLNLERRTGVKNADIDDFNRKVDDVNAAIKALMDGSIKPEDVRIEGLPSEEEKRQEEIQRQERLAAIRIKNEKLRQERKAEESKRWWAGAEIFRPNMNKENDVDEESSTLPISKGSRYSLDYSKWSEWTPTDEATKAEESELQRQEEDKKNKEFEANNAEFCKQFMDDTKERQKSVQKKAESSDISRLKGNRYYQAKQYERALELYMEALKDSPYDTKTLTNIAQAHIKLKANEDALEFLNRTLYLEPLHVKAQSRKAFVCSEMGDTATALSLIDKVIALEPGNAELLALKREIQSIEKEKHDLKALEQSQPTEAGASGATGLGVLADVDALVALLAKKESSLQDDFLRSVSVSVNSIQSRLLPELDSAKLYVRTSGTFKAVLDLLADVFAAAGVAVGSTKGEPVFDFQSPAHIAVLGPCLRLVAVSVTGQRGAKQLLVDSKLLGTVKQLLAFCTQVTSEDAECGLTSALVDGAVHLIYECAWDDSLAKLRTSALSDVALASTLSTVLHKLAVSVSSSAMVGLWSEGQLRLIDRCLLILKEFISEGKDKSSLSSVVNQVSASIGSVFLCHMVMRATVDLNLWNGSVFASSNHAVSVLLELSQAESYRPSFAVPLSFESHLQQSTAWRKYVKQSTAGAVVFAVEAAEEFASNCLAVLMNASLEASDAVKKAVAKDGGASMLVNSLLLSDEQRRAQDSSVLVRKAGLLSRLAQIDSVQSVLKLPANYAMLCRRINLTGVASPEQWLLDERSHYIRSLASLTTISAECREVGLRENVLASVLDAFPVPREDCGVITAQTVTLMPLVAVPALQLGNAARCLMAYADDTKSAEVLYCRSDLKGVEKLICGMASCTDMRVRKNIAILLAKGCRIEGVRARVSALRGLQMMVELQDKL